MRCEGEMTRWHTMQGRAGIVNFRSEMKQNNVTQLSQLTLLSIPAAPAGQIDRSGGVRSSPLSLGLCSLSWSPASSLPRSAAVRLHPRLPSDSPLGLFLPVGTAETWTHKGNSERHEQHEQTSRQTGCTRSIRTDVRAQSQQTAGRPSAALPSAALAHTSGSRSHSSRVRRQSTVHLATA
jgi:hypothetical protein